MGFDAADHPQPGPQDGVELNINVVDRPQPSPEDGVEQNIQIGMVQIVQRDIDPVFGNLSPIGHLPHLGPSPEVYRYWVKFFSHHSQYVPSVLIPNS